MAVTLKEIAWNGIHISVPAEWDLGRIRTRHLFFIHHERPAMEIKWSAVKGRFSLRSHLKKLIAQQKHHANKNLKEWDLPSAWKNALSDFVTKGFSWQSGAEQGHGAILFCPSCSNAIVLQIFGIAGSMTDEAVPDILKSLADHRNDQQTAWTVFDIHALLPKALRLKNYSFKPGNFELIFSHGSKTVKLYRWAPASVFLSNTGLEQFAADILALTPEKLVKTSIQGNPAVEWRSNATTGWHSPFYRFIQKPARVRLWHVVKKNRILGVRMEGKTGVDVDMMTKICENYHLAFEEGS